MLLHEEIARRGVRLILASQSPRRRQLMEDAGLRFDAVSYDVEEIFPSDMRGEDVAEYLSQLKSEGYPSTLRDGDVLITADTVVLLGGEVLGKPCGVDGARAMLGSLSGREHIVITGVTLRSRRGSRSFSTQTKVCFGTLSIDEIAYYVDRYLPLDKAGSYGIQEWIGYVGVEQIEGSFYNVMGLPIQRLYRELSDFIEKSL